jgi:hypothetical protein
VLDFCCDSSTLCLSRCCFQRYGPPPSYPNLKIPGLNAPIPPGASFGYHAGDWGKPPVDAHGNPIYGDVFGLAQVRKLVCCVICRLLSAVAFDKDACGVLLAGRQRVCC